MTPPEPAPAHPSSRSLPTVGRGPGMSPNVADCIEVAAGLMAAQSGSAQRALDTHHARADGRCSRCGYTVQWPCVTVVSAWRALEMLDEQGNPEQIKNSMSPTDA